MEIIEEDFYLGRESPEDDENWYKCTECNFKNKVSTNLNYHMTCHTRNKKVKCPLCSFSADSKCWVSRHVKQHHLNLPNAVPAHQLEFIQDIEYVIQNVLEIDDNPLESYINENNDHLPNSAVNEDEVENEEMDQSEEPTRTEFIYKCSLCDYSTDHSANARVHEKAHNQGDEKEFKCSVCNYSSNLKFVVIRHMTRDHHNSALSAQENDIMDSASHFENNFKQTEEVDITYSGKIEFVDVSIEDDDESKGILLMNSYTKGDLLRRQQQSILVKLELEQREAEVEEADCRKRISQCKKEIRLSRTTIAEMRGKVKLQKETRSEKEKQKELKSRYLEMIRLNNQKLIELSTEYNKLEILRAHIRETDKRKLESVLQLREMQIKKLKDQQHLYEADFADELVLCLKKSDDTDATIRGLKSNIKGMKNELKFLREEEEVLAKKVELLSQSFNGVVNKVDEKVLQNIECEIEKLEREVRASLRDDTEDMFNQLVISTEENVRNLFQLKNNLFDIMFARKSIIRRMSGFM